MGADNNPRHVAMTAVLLLVAAGWCGGCAGGGQEVGSNSRNRVDSGGVRESMTMDDLDLGENWIDDDASALAMGGSSGPTTSPGGARPTSRTTYWGIVLRTFSGDDHRSAAANMVRSAATIDPRLGQAHPHTTSKGSMVVYGIYESAESAAAQRDLEWIKGIEIRNRQVFPRAILSRINPDPGRRRFAEHELMSVRRRYPHVDPLYTLQVGVWGDFNSGMTLEAIRGRAERHVSALRSKGYESYVHHDDDKRLSMVTVGLFDRSAVDAQSGIFDPEVERLFRDFPAHLVNGEPLEEPLNARAPQLGTRTQAPKLVLVPRR